MNFYTREFMVSGYHSSYGSTRSYTRFFLPSLLSGAQISSAQVQVYQAVSDAANTIELRRVTTGWIDSTISWNNQPSFSATAESSVNSTTIGYWNFDLTRLSIDWYSGAAPNYGFVLKAQNETSSRRAFRTSEYAADAVYRPKLTVNYVVEPVGSESFWAEVGGVNVKNGNLVISDTDTAIPGRGVPVVLSRTYNSNPWSYDNSALYGHGWRLNLAMSIKSFGTAASPAVFTDGDGTPHIFARNFDGSYTSPGGVYLTLRKNAAEPTWVLEENSGTKYNFNSSGKLTSIVDTNSNTTTLTYNAASGKLERITDASSRAATLAYDASGRLQSITDAASRVTRYGYNAAGELETATNPIGGIIRYGYDPNHRITSITDPKGFVTNISYDPATGRVRSISRNVTLNGVLTTLTTNFTYDTTAEKTTVTDPKGIATEYYWNAQGNVTKVVADAGVGKKNITTTYTWDALNNPLAVTDPNGQPGGPNAGANSQFGYDSSGNLVEARKESGYSSIFKYSRNDLTEAKDFVGAVTRSNYDPNRNLTEFIDPASTASIYRRAANGNILGVTDPMGLADNLLPNNGFEAINASSVPDYWIDIAKGSPSDTVVSDAATLFSGERSLKIVANSATGVAYARSTYVPVSPNVGRQHRWRRGSSKRLLVSR
jgi:YD repeat-containing protein